MPQEKLVTTESDATQTPKKSVGALNNLSYQILGTLLRAPSSGYDVVKVLEHFRPAKASQIYPTLAKLAAAGLVESATISQETRPNKRIYTVTELGRSVLANWVGTTPEPAYHRDDFLTMVYSGWLKSPADLRNMFLERKAGQQQKLDKLTTLLASMERVHTKEIDSLEDWQFFSAMLTRRRIAVLREDMNWTMNMMHRLNISDA